MDNISPLGIVSPKDLQNTQATVPSATHLHILTVIPSSSLKLMCMSSIICIHYDNSDRHLSKPLPTGNVWMLWLKLQNSYEKQYNWPSREQISSSILIHSDQVWHIEYKYSCYSVFFLNILENEIIRTWADAFKKHMPWPQLTTCLSVQVSLH